MRVRVRVCVRVCVCVRVRVRVRVRVCVYVTVCTMQLLTACTCILQWCTYYSIGACVSLHLFLDHNVPHESTVGIIVCVETTHNSNLYVRVHVSTM